MLKCFSYFFACLLLVLIPLQSIAAANMSICNSVMQSHISEQQSQAKPCSMHMLSMSKNTQNQDCCAHKSACKTICATLCSGMSAVTMLPSGIKPAIYLVSSSLISLPYQAYASITQPNLQRPPILLA